MYYGAKLKNYNQQFKKSNRTEKKKSLNALHTDGINIGQTSFFSVIQIIYTHVCVCISILGHDVKWGFIMVKFKNLESYWLEGGLFI